MKDQELEFLKRKLKTTKINELEIELEVTQNHLIAIKQYYDNKKINNNLERIASN